jgi:hypothetical protein
MFFDPEMVYEDNVLYYDKERNIMIDDGGFEVTNIFSIVAPYLLNLFKMKKESMCCFGRAGQIVELVYPEESEDDLDY